MSSPPSRQGGSFGDELTNAALICLVGMFGIALILRASGTVAAFLTGTTQPTAGPASGLGVLFNPADPGAALQADGLNAVVYWIVTTVLLAGLCAGGGWVWVRLRRHTRKTETDPRRLAGTATGHEVSQTASAKALLRHASTLRPSLDDPTPSDVGYLLGTSHGKQVWASVEDSILLLGPPRSGKGLHVVINAILDAPGAVVTTSTRPDNLTATLKTRQRDGRPVGVFDPQHLLATGAGAGAAASLVAAFVEDLVEAARRLAARSPGARLDPPLLLALDEIGNLSPLPSLPTLMAEGGGTGITCLPVLQSLAQAREKWGDNAAGAIWDASIVKIILGGASNSRDLQDLSTLIGERDEYTDSVTLGDHGTRSNQRSVRRVPILPPDRIRTLPFGTGVTLLRSAPPVVTDLRPWPKRPDGDQLRKDRRDLEALLRRNS